MYANDLIITRLFDMIDKVLPIVSQRLLFCILGVVPLPTYINPIIIRNFLFK